MNWKSILQKKKEKIKEQLDCLGLLCQCKFELASQPCFLARLCICQLRKGWPLRDQGLHQLISGSTAPWNLNGNIKLLLVKVAYFKYGQRHIVLKCLVDEFLGAPKSLSVFYKNNPTLVQPNQTEPTTMNKAKNLNNLHSNKWPFGYISLKYFFFKFLWMLVN